MSDITQAQADAVLGAARESARETARFFDMATGSIGELGAIGVSGSTVENDHTVAFAGAAGRR